MSAADFTPFDARMPSWALTTDGLLTGRCQDADGGKVATAAPKTAEISHSAAAVAGYTDVTDDTDGGKADWRTGVAAMLAMPRPAWVPIARWGRLRSAIIGVRDEWAEAAFVAGWSEIDLFGCNPDPSAGRVDRNGLVACLAGQLAPVAIKAVRNRVAEIVDEGGSVMRMRLPIADGSVPLWVAYATASGP